MDTKEIKEARDLMAELKNFPDVESLDDLSSFLEIAIDALEELRDKQENTVGVPMDHVLPFDIEINHIKFGKGTKLQTFIDAAIRWHTEAMITNR